MHSVKINLTLTPKIFVVTINNSNPMLFIVTSTSGVIKDTDY